MKIVYKMAFRNLFRRKGRSTLLITIVATAVFAASFVVALGNGFTDGIFREYINIQTSHLQIHVNNLSEINEVSNFMDKRMIQEALNAVDEVESSSYRLKTNALVSTVQTSVGLTLIGVDRDDEIKVSSLYSTIDNCDGTFFESNVVRPIVLSKRSAEKLNVGVKSRIIVSFQDSSGEIQKVLFRVVGLFKSNTKSFDNSIAFVQNSDLMPYLNLPDGAVHEVAIIVNDLKECDNIKQKISQLLPDHDVRKWNEIVPIIDLLSAWHGLANLLSLTIFFITLGFSLTNFILMSVLERKGEFRMLNKVGMCGRNIGAMIVIETLFTTLIATLAGLLISTIAVLIFSKSGIDIKFIFENESGYGLGTVICPVVTHIYPVIYKMDFVYIFVLVIVISMVATISPIKKVLK